MLSPVEIFINWGFFNSILLLSLSSVDLHHNAIHGNLLLKGYEPDGDSVRFQTDDLSLFKDVYRGHLLEPNRRDKVVQLGLKQ
jgi:hypothetical protein